jgi:hypothetical protein
MRHYTKRNQTITRQRARLTASHHEGSGAD